MNRLALKTLASSLSILLALSAPGAAPYAAAGQASRGPVATSLKVPLGLTQLPAITLDATALPQISPLTDLNAPSLGALSPKTAAPQAVTAAAVLQNVSKDAVAAQAILQNAQAAPETAGIAAAATFEGAKKQAPSELAPVTLGAVSANAPSGLVKNTGVVSSSSSSSSAKRLVSRAIRAGRRVFWRYQAAPKPLQYLAAASVAVLASLALPYYAGGMIVPLVLGTCNAMQERAIKDATILPQEQDEARRALAKIELDAALVSFGKELRKAAISDPRVISAISAHDAEHAMEEPLLELMPKWRQRWMDGNGPTQAEALAELRAAVLDRLKTKVLTREDEALVEELFDKSGGWDKFLEWEAKYGIFEALKKAGEAAAAEKKNQVQKKADENGNTGQMGGGGALLSVGLILGASALLSLLGFDGAGAGFALAMMAGVVVAAPSAADPKNPKPGETVALEAYLKNLGLDDEEAELLMSFTVDIGAKDLAPAIGRSKEIQRVITILSKPAGMQNNPMILGDKGVGKTVVVETVAKRLYENRLPSLAGKRILELDMGRLTAGASAVGELEKRLMALRDIVQKTDNKVVLFVDEIHTLLKSNTTSNSVPDLLKSPLRNGDMTVIGATTVGEYRQYMEKDPAFSDRFDSVNVDEPKQDEAIEMLEGNLEYLEKKFQVEIDPEAAAAAVRLSARYIPEKFLPRKAAVLLQNAIAEAKPAAMRDGLQVQIDQLTDRLRIFVRRYAKLAKEGDDNGDAAKRAEIVRAYNRVVAAYQTILSLEDRQRALKEEKITKEHVLRTLAKETGLDLGDMGADDYAKLQSMEPWFKERVVGQDDAIAAITEAVRRNKSGLNDPDRPLGVFLFPGPTGVGKTEIARRLTEFLFNDVKAMTRIDMSEYQEKFSVQRLFGAPPGYVGYDQGGQLTEAVRRKPYSVVLLDEIEKAHPDVLLALLQVFEDGRMTDGKGVTVDFKNTIIIMTSNMGAEAVSVEDLMRILRTRLKPEFINRIDKIVRFNALDISQAEAIVNIQLDRVRKRLRAQDLEIVISPESVTWLAKKGFDPAYGARPLKRTVESEITDKVGEFLLAKRADGTLVNGGVVNVTEKDGKLDFELKPNPPPSVAMSPLPEGPLGAKLRNILEEAVRTGGESQKDLRTFEALLFPDRFEITLEGPLGAFEPDAEAGEALNGENSQTIVFKAKPGERETAIQDTLKELDATLAGRWNETSREALEAWLEAFVGLAKSVRSAQTPGEPQAAGGVYAIPAAAGQFGMNLYVPVDGQARQKLLRAFRDHFTVPLADEAALRKRAGDLKDEGKEVDRALLEAKRLIESIPGARFGYEERDGNANFWLTFGVDAKPVPAKTETQAEVELPDLSGLELATPAKPYQPDTNAPDNRVEQTETASSADAAWQDLRPYYKDANFPNSSRDAVRYWLEYAYAQLNEAAGANAKTYSVGARPDGTRVLEVSAVVSARSMADTPFLALLRQTPNEVDAVVSQLKDARYGFNIVRENAVSTLSLWIAMPGSLIQAPVEEKEARVTALEARTSPGKMLLYLAPASNTQLGALRKLTASMLDSKSSAARLLGLHLASSLLPKAAYGEVAAISRGVRLADNRDSALFADLSARSSLGMSAQRKAVRDGFDAQLRAVVERARANRTSNIGDTYVQQAEFYASLLTRLGDRLTEKETGAARESSLKVSRYWRLRLLLTMLASSLSLGIPFTLWNMLGWSMGWMIAVAIVGNLIFWIWFGSWTADGGRTSGRYNADALDKLIVAAGADKTTKPIALGWLKRAAAGKLGDALNPRDVLAAAAGVAAPKTLARWLDKLEKYYAAPLTKGTRDTSGPRIESLVALGHAHDLLSAEQRARALPLLLAPLRERWLPSSPAEYSEALGVWLEKAELSVSQIDATLDILTIFPSGSNASWTNLLPAINGLAKQSKLTGTQRAALDQLVSSLLAESLERNTRNPEYIAILQAARARARLGLGRGVWETLRAPLSQIQANGWSLAVMAEVAALIKEFAPLPLDRAWLEPRLRDSIAQSTDSRSAARLALSRLLEDPADRVTMLIAALNEFSLDRVNGDQPERMKTLLDELHSAVRKLRLETPVEQVREFDKAATGNVSRLNAAQP